MRAEVAIAGGGIIGLALGLELQAKGRQVVVLERGQAMRGASWAAGGMLAVEDPQNPEGLMPLARLSGAMYAKWLAQVEELSRMPVPMRTRQALQWVKEADADDYAMQEEIAALAPGLVTEGLTFQLLEEGSVDPRDLCAALPKAFAAAGGKLMEGSGVEQVAATGNGVSIRTAQGEWAAEQFVNCCGAWSGSGVEGLVGLPVEPVKGQMVEMRCAPERLRCVVRAPGAYLIPRGDGRVTVGATIEHAGFDTAVEEAGIRGLMGAALTLLAELEESRPLKCWTGLRPGTPDGLPVMGEAEVRGCWHATGHYRDGILLAPATARVMAQEMSGERPEVSLEAFSMARFAGRAVGD